MLIYSVPDGSGTLGHEGLHQMLTFFDLPLENKFACMKAFRLYGDDYPGLISYLRRMRVADDPGIRTTDEELQEADGADRAGARHHLPCHSL